MAKNGLLRILVCVSGLGLAACSGGGGAPTDGTGVGGEPSEPSEPNPLQQAENRLNEAQRAVEIAEERLQALQEAGTAAERADATLRLEALRADRKGVTAEVELERARVAMVEVVGLAQTAATAEERRSTLDRIAAAEEQIAQALATADEALEAAVAAGSAEGAAEASAAARSFAMQVRERAGQVFAIVSRYQASAASRIQELRLQVSVGLGQGPDAGEPGTPPTVTTPAISRVPRTKSDGSAAAEADRLGIAQTAVPYSDGKRVISADPSGEADELPLRELTVRIGTTEVADVRVQGDDKSPTAYSLTDGVPVASIKLDSTGVVYKYGGEGVAFHDLQRDFGVGGSVDAWLTQEDECGTSDLGACYDWNSYDLSITWTGSPGNAPNGERVWYWRTRVPLPEGQSATQANLLSTFQNGRNDWDLGLYELWVTNHGGADRNLEPSAGKGLRSPADDVDRFLSYAAYGLFVHTDTLTDYMLPSRVQAFHFGYDAFEDKDGRKTTDIATPVSVTFNGRTMGFMYEHNDNPNPARVEFRGDIVLNASIGGTGGGTISGEIKNFEKLGANGRWLRFERAAKIHETAGSDTANFAHRLVFAHKDDYRPVNGHYPQDYAAAGAPIAADGSYEGGVYAQFWDGSAWDPFSWVWDSTGGTSNSKFGGTLYGPTGENLDGLETAGYWYLQADTREQRWGGLVGSFGATGTAVAE